MILTGACNHKRLNTQDMIMRIHNWEKIDNNVLQLFAVSDYKGQKTEIEIQIKLGMKPIEYNVVTGAINIDNPEKVNVDGVSIISKGTEFDLFLMSLAEMFKVELTEYVMCPRINFLAFCIESYNEDFDELNQKYLLLTDETEGADNYGEIFLSIDMEEGLIIISESNEEYRKNIIEALSGSENNFFDIIKEKIGNAGEYFESIDQNMKRAKIIMKLNAIGRESVRIMAEPFDENMIEIGRSRLGGKPDLPDDFHWPQWKGRSISFIAQINLCEIEKYKISNYLPVSGLLYFFYDVADQTIWGYDPDDKGSFEVVFADVNQDRLRRWDFPEDLPEESRFDSGLVKFSKEMTVPSSDSIFIEGLNLSDKEINLLSEIQEEVVEEIKNCHINRIMGFPDIIEGEMETLCALVSDGKYCGGSIEIEEERLLEYLKDAEEWRLLLQVDSQDNLGFLWGDGGRLYFWIKESDLRNRDFSKVWMLKQSS